MSSKTRAPGTPTVILWIDPPNGIAVALSWIQTATTKPKDPIRGKRICAAHDSACFEAIMGLRQM